LIFERICAIKETIEELVLYNLVFDLFLINPVFYTKKAGDFGLFQLKNLKFSRAWRRIKVPGRVNFKVYISVCIYPQHNMCWHINKLEISVSARLKSSFQLFFIVLLFDFSNNILLSTIIQNCTVKYYFFQKYFSINGVA